MPRVQSVNEVSLHPIKKILCARFFAALSLALLLNFIVNQLFQ